jgi:hypothetical protein
MTYLKPALRCYAAIAKIQSGPNEKTGIQKEPGKQQVTPAAYEADE